ncbi:hypothetical protein COY17_02190 [Candidatus Saccharibacteria bacterium CG_4_10_14_0_2_um_filter_52_9]|nr:MAG: hypothetical protein COY17_02190 [Candidatus Saccharibacteria bacterium CG_4_10_14_0_2_um_filter_52_9]
MDQATLERINYFPGSNGLENLPLQGKIMKKSANSSKLPLASDGSAFLEDGLEELSTKKNRVRKELIAAGISQCSMV